MHLFQVIEMCLVTTSPDPLAPTWTESLSYEKGVEKISIGPDRIGLTKPGLDRSGLTEHDRLTEISAKRITGVFERTK